MPQLILNFEDGLTRSMEGLPNETVVETAYRMGMNIPLDCADGACGTCKCKIISGTFDAGSYIDDALTEEEFAQGFGLACQMRPHSAMIVNILASAAACKVKIDTIPSVLVRLEVLCAEVFKLVLRPQNGLPVPFLAGQYANIEVPGSGITRSYSFSSMAGNIDMEFLIRTLPEGLMSTWLREKASIGDILHITGPIGSFYTRPIARPVLFFAGGTGIAPFLSMLETLSRFQPVHGVSLFYGVTAEENLVETERLDHFHLQSGFGYSVCIAGPSAHHARGFVTQWINKEHLTAPEYDIYICGPNGMVDAVRNKLEAEEIPFKNFYTEKFLPSGTLAAV